MTGHRLWDCGPVLKVLDELGVLTGDKDYAI